MAKRIKIENAPTPDELSEVWRIIALSGDTSMSASRIKQAVRQAVDMGALRPEAADAAKAYAVYGGEILKNRQSRMMTGLAPDEEIGSITPERVQEKVVVPGAKPKMEEDIPNPILRVVKESLQTKPGQQLYMITQQAAEQEGEIPGSLEARMASARAAGARSAGVETQYIGRPPVPKTREEALAILQELAIPRGGSEAKIRDVPMTPTRTGDEIEFSRPGQSEMPLMLRPEQAREAEKLARRRIASAGDRGRFMEGAKAEGQPDALKPRILGTQDIEPTGVFGATAAREKGGARGLVRKLLDALGGLGPKSPYARSRASIAKRMASEKKLAAARAKDGDKPEFVPNKYSASSGTLVTRRKGKPKVVPTDAKERAAEAKKAESAQNEMQRRAMREAARIRQEDAEARGPAPRNLREVSGKAKRKGVAEPLPKAKRATTRSEAGLKPRTYVQDPGASGVDTEGSAKIARENEAIGRALDALVARGEPRPRRPGGLGGAHENILDSRNAPFREHPRARGVPPDYVPKGKPRKAGRKTASGRSALSRLLELGKAVKLPRQYKEGRK
jgi:hypothetical protein